MKFKVHHITLTQRREWRISDERGHAGGKMWQSYNTTQTNENIQIHNSII
jgi:hypothetical protein